jgi:hypothetical protein
VNVKKTNTLLLLYFQMKDMSDNTYSKYTIQHIYEFDTIVIVGDMSENRMHDALPPWIEDAIKNKIKVYNPITIEGDITIACDYINNTKAKEYLVKLQKKPNEISILNPPGYKLSRRKGGSRNSFNDFYSVSTDSVEHMDKKINRVENRNPRGLNWDMGYSLLFNSSTIASTTPNIKLRHNGPNHIVFVELENNVYVFVLKHIDESNNEAVNRLFKQNVTIKEYEIGYLASVLNSNTSWVEYIRVKLDDLNINDLNINHLKRITMDENRFISLPKLSVTFI